MRVMQNSKATRSSRGATKRGIENKNKDSTRAKKSRYAESNESTGLTHINEFPPHVLGIIFCNLTPIDRLCSEKVCRLWRNLSIAGYGWNEQATISCEELFNYKFIGSRPELTNRHIEILLKRSRHHLKTLDLSSFQYQMQLNYSICSTLTYVRNLDNLNLSCIRLTNSSLSSIGRNLPSLKKVSFRHSFKNTLMERGLSSFFMHCRQLEYLDLSENELLTGTSFSDIPKSLLSLNIASCYRLKTDAIRGIQQNCANLQKLVINQLDTIPAVHLNNMFKSLKNLTCLHFSECYGAEFYEGQPSLISLGDIPTLKELHFCDNMLMNNQVLRAICVGCKSLEILNIALSNRHITNTGLQNISSLPNLTELNITGQRSITDDTLAQIVNRGTLKALLVGKCSNISNTSVLHVIKTCKHLAHLDVSFCTGVTPVIFKELDKTMFVRHGKSQPNGANDDRKFRLAIARSGVYNNVPDKYSPWIKIMEPYDIFQTSPTFVLAHFVDFPMAAVNINNLMG